MLLQPLQLKFQRPPMSTAHSCNKSTSDVSSSEAKIAEAMSKAVGTSLCIVRDISKLQAALTNAALPEDILQKLLKNLDSQKAQAAEVFTSLYEMGDDVPARKSSDK